MKPKDVPGSFVRPADTALGGVGLVKLAVLFEEVVRIVWFGLRIAADAASVYPVALVKVGAYPSILGDVVVLRDRVPSTCYKLTSA